MQQPFSRNATIESSTEIKSEAVRLGAFAPAGLPLDRDSIVTFALCMNRYGQLG